MRFSVCLLLLASIFAVAGAAIAGEDDSTVFIFTYGRASSWMASGFAVVDGSYVVTTSDTVLEPAPTGKRLPVSHAIVASPWTGDAYAAEVVAYDEQSKIAVLKLQSPIAPPVPLLDRDKLSKIIRATEGQLLSGEDVGSKYPAYMYALDVEKKPATKFVVKSWRAENAFQTEIRDHDWVFLSQVKPSEKAPQGALVVKLGLGAIGMFQGRVVVEGGQRPVTFYRVLPSFSVSSFLTKSGITIDESDKSSALPLRASDSDRSFQVMCGALSASEKPNPFTDAAQAAVKMRPRSAVARMLHAMALGRDGKAAESLKEIDAALEIDPRLPNAKLSRAAALAAAGKTTDAEKELRQAAQDAPKDARPLLSLSSLLAENKETLPEAVKLAREAVRLSPDDPAAHIALARWLKRSKDYDGAVAELKALLSAAPKWADVEIALGLTYEAAGKPDLAAAVYRKVVGDNPESPEAHITLIDFLVAAGKKDEARKAIEAARKLKLSSEASDAITKLEAGLNATEKK